jgi:glycosyltransferase 2 family protein
MYRKRAALFAISLVLLAALFLSIDYPEFFDVVARLRPEMVVVLVLLQGLILFLNALKWHVIIRRYAVSFTNVLYTSLIGSMVNNLTPASVAGGEPVKAYILSKIDRIKMEKAFATVFVDLFITVLPVLILNIFAVLLVLKYRFDLRIAWALILVGLFLIALIVASFSILLHRQPSLRLLNRLIRAFGRLPPLKKHAARLESRVDELFAGFHHSIRDTMTDTWTLSVSTIVSTVVWVLGILRIYLVFRALNVPVDVNALVIVYTVMLTVSILPLLPGALGMWELVGTGLFVFFGVPAPAAAAVILLDRLLSYWLTILIGFLASLHVGLNVMRLLDRSG